jgi:hypothetical protein
MKKREEKKEGGREKDIAFVRRMKTRTKKCARLKLPYLAVALRSRAFVFN